KPRRAATLTRLAIDGVEGLIAHEMRIAHKRGRRAVHEPDCRGIVGHAVRVRLVRTGLTFQLQAVRLLRRGRRPAGADSAPCESVFREADEFVAMLTVAVRKLKDGTG